MHFDFHHTKKQLLFVIKVTILTTLFSALWIIIFFESPLKHPTGDHMHEDDEKISIENTYQFDLTVSKQQVDNNINTIVENVLDENQGEEHNAATMNDTQIQQRFDEMCSIYADVCNKTIRDSTYNNQQKLFYQGIIIYLMNKLDGSLSSGESIRNTISYIKLFEDNEARRGSAGHTYIKLNSGQIQSRSEFREVLTHEFGHIIDLGVVTGQSRSINSSYTEFGVKKRSIDDLSIDFYEITWESEDIKKSGVGYLDFVSGYAMKGIYEDFAESANLYKNHNALFKHLASKNNSLKKKYEFFDSLFNGAYVKTSQELLPRYADEKRYWDTTKLKTEMTRQ